MATWSQLIVNGGNPVSARDSGLGFKLNDRLFLSNGYMPGGNNIRDLWRSADEGGSWTLVNGATPYEVYSAIATLDNAIFAVGTRVWRSVNGGSSFSDLGAGPQQTVDTDARIVQINSTFYLISGAATKVWKSVDLVSWSALDVPGWGPAQRGSCAIAGYKNRVYLLTGNSNVANVPVEGGYTWGKTITDVWSMGEDEVWRQEPTPPWTGRWWPTAIEGMGYLWLYGGYRNRSVPQINYAELWRMDSDGNWTPFTVSGAPGPRHAPTLWFSNGKLIVGFGNNNPPGTTQNDVWALTP